MIRTEYLRFLQTLNNPSVPEAVRKIANLVAINLDELVPLSTYQGQRVRRIVALAQRNWEAVRPDIQPIPEINEEHVAKFSQLNRLTVGPFRGFAKQEVFDLASRLVLVYGPNGTGKSSFCEALEYGLLGNVVEAESKRFRDQSEYLKNAYVNQLSPPNIYGDDGEGNEIAIAPNEAVYRFCFVEKNRIDSFSRIAAQAPAKQTELISTLFGLDSFSEFVRNFTAEIGDRYIDLVGVKGNSLAQKRQGLAGAEQQIITNTAELESIAASEYQLANQYREGISYDQLVLDINGNGQAPGIISQLEAELQQPVSLKSGLTSANLSELSNSIAVDSENLVLKQQALANASQQVSFKQLYEAVSQLQESNPEECPACQTPLNRVAVNPYVHASNELRQLQELAQTQQAAYQLQQNVHQSLSRLVQIISTCLRYYPQNNILHSYQLANKIQPDIQWWNTLNQQLPDGYTPWQHIGFQVSQLEASDNQIDQAAQTRARTQAELSRYRQIATQITALQTRRSTAIKAIATAQQLISNFTKENAQLIADVEAEKAVIQNNRAISSAYSDFVTRLNAYSSGLPAHLVADLSERVTDLYNAFNRNDSVKDLLAEVRLPLAQNQRMIISFQNDPERFHDALHVLSEGHIRCLGLAILLAKNIKEDSPVLIFDDPVNAIDDDHRESIRKTLFEDQYFAEKQILLTCHGEEFYKDIFNLLPAQTASQSRAFTFLPQLDESHIRVDFNSSPRNYILAARAHIDRNEIRDALTKSRQALESLAKGKVWRYVNRHGDGNLSIKLRAAKAPIELRNLAEQLKIKIAKVDFADPNKNSVFDPLETILGLNGDSREWRYLNKGTHEEIDRAEFDRHTVEEIISALEHIDAALA